MDEPVTQITPEDAALVLAIRRYEAAKEAIPATPLYGLSGPEPEDFGAARLVLDRARRAVEQALRRRRSIAYGGKSYFLDSMGDLHIVRMLSVGEAVQAFRIRGSPHRASEVREHRPGHVTEKRIRGNY